MAAISSISLMHQVAENNIVTGRYCKRFYPREQWVGSGAEISTDATTGALQLYREPVTDTIMLAPVYNIDADTTDAACTQTGGTWAEVSNLWGTTCKFLEQTDASAAETSVEPTTAYAAGQAFYIDLYLGESTNADYLVTIDFGSIWRVTIGRTGLAALWCKDTPDAEEGDYTVRAKGTLTENGASVFGRRHTLSFWPLKRKWLLVKTGLSDGGREIETVLVDENAPAVAPTGDNPDYDPWTITYEASPKVTVSNGRYIVGFRKVTYAESGTWTSPKTTMHELTTDNDGPGYTGALSPTLDYVNWGGAVVGTVLDWDNALLGAEADKTKYRIRLTLGASSGDHTMSPQVFWAEAAVGESASLNGAVEGDYGAYVQRITETLALEDGSHNISIAFRPLSLDDPGGIASWSDRHCLNAYGTLTVNGVGRTAFYTSDPDWAAFEKFGQLSWDRCENRLARLKRTMISDATAYDGMAHTLAVKSLLELAGFVDNTDFVWQVDLATPPLPTAREDEEPLWRYANGTTVYDAIRHICEKYSGWHLYVGSDFKIHYDPIDSETVKATFSKVSAATAQTRRIMSWQTRSDSTQFYNQIWVVGESSADKSILVGFWQAPASWSITGPYGTGTVPNAIVGEQRKLIYIDPALCTMEAVEQAKLVLRTRCGQPRLLATMQSGYDVNLRPGDWIEADNPPESGVSGLSMSKWQIVSMTTEIDGEDAKATYELEWKGNWGGLT